MLSAVVAVLLVPPVNLALLALLCVLLSWRRLAAVLLALLLLLALPAVSDSLTAALELDLPKPAAAPQAIVVLGGDVTPIGPDGRQDIGVLTLARLRAGAALARSTGLPLLVTGGVLDDGAAALATLMAHSLTEDFAVTPRWIEPQALDTWGNARFSAALLKPDGITAVYVVSQPWHLRRALMAFRAAGLSAAPAPLPLDPMPDGRPGDFVPRASDWRRSFLALHEWIGCAWYALRQARG